MGLSGVPPFLFPFRLWLVPLVSILLLFCCDICFLSSSSCSLFAFPLLLDRVAREELGLSYSFTLESPFVFLSASLRRASMFVIDYEPLRYYRTSESS